MKRISLLLGMLICGVSHADGEEFKPVHMLPDGPYKAIKAASDGNVSLKDKLKHVKAALCSGDTPKVHIKYTVDHVSPRTKGLALDVAAKTKQQAIIQLIDYLKNHFFADAANENGEHAFSNGFYTPYADDLSFLRSTFTFILPKPLVSKLMGKVYTKESFGDSPEIQNFGYDYETETFAPSLAIKNGEWIWEKVFGYSTSMVQGPTQDSVKINMTLDLSIFCQYAVPVTDLISE